MEQHELNKRFTKAGYGLNAFIAMVLPLCVLIDLHFDPTSSIRFLTNVFGFSVLAAIGVSIICKNRYLYILNLFSGVLFLNVFMNSRFPLSFIHLVFIIYALVTLFFYFLECKKGLALKSVDQ